MKTIAARFDDQVFELLALVAQLEETTIVDEIRQGVEMLLSLKLSNGELAERAEAALQEIDREAAAKRAAIAGLIGAASDSEAKPKPKPKSTSRRRPRSTSDQGTLDGEPQAKVIPMGFAPNRDRQ
jgi:hypothetical protein